MFIRIIESLNNINFLQFQGPNIGSYINYSIQNEIKVILIIYFVFYIFFPEEDETIGIVKLYKSFQ